MAVVERRARRLDGKSPWQRLTKISKGIVNSSVIEASGSCDQKNWNNFNGSSHTPFALEA